MIGFFQQFMADLARAREHKRLSRQTRVVGVSRYLTSLVNGEFKETGMTLGHTCTFIVDGNGKRDVRIQSTDLSMAHKHKSLLFAVTEWIDLGALPKDALPPLVMPPPKGPAKLLVYPGGR